jgi:group I intron endonuclease
MSGCIYLFTNTVNLKRYVGQHCNPDPIKRYRAHINDTKNGSQFPIHNAIRKYGIKSFTFEVLCICSLESLTNMEGYYAEVLETYVWDEKGYNAAWCADSPCLGLKRSAETRQKMSEAAKNMSAETRKKLSEAAKNISAETRQKLSEAAKNISAEHRQKLSESNKGKIRSAETRQKMSESNKGKIISAETRKKMSEALKGKIISAETRQKLSEAGKGRIISAETLKKLSESNKGKIRSAETRQKMSESAKARQAKAKNLNDPQPS